MTGMVTMLTKEIIVKINLGKLLNYRLDSNHKIPFKDRLMHNWQQFYHRENNNDGQSTRKYRWSWDDWLMASLMSFLLSRGLLSVFGPDWLIYHHYYHLFYGVFYQLLNVEPYRFEALFIFWSFNHLSAMLCVLFFDRSHFRWIDTLDVLESDCGYRIGLYSVENIALQKYARQQYFVLNLICKQTVTTILPLFTILYLYSYDWPIFIMSSVPWIVICMSYAHLLVGLLYLVLPYLVILKKIIQIKLNRFSAELCPILSNPLVPFRNSQTKLSLHQMARLLTDLHHYNRFWKHMISITMFWRIFIIEFTAFIIFFLSFISITPFFILVCLNELSSLLVVIGLAGTIGLKMGTIRKRILCLVAKRNRAQRKIATFITKFKLLNFIETLGSDRGTGFCFMNDVRIKPYHLIVIVSQMSQLFFLMVMLSYRR